MTQKSSTDYTKEFTDWPQARSVFPSLKQEFPDEGQWNWDAIQHYCESCPSAIRSFLEETSRIQKRYGNQDADYQKAMETFLHHFAFEASIYLHSKEKNYIEDLFDQCAAHPDRTAVVDQNGERRTSYAEFVSLIRKTTSKIKSLGLKEHSFIIINMGRCREYPAAMYAVVLSGHALIPLVPETPPDREAYIAAEAESSYTIREDFFDDIDSYAEAEGRMPDADDTAMMLYTSGSTGRPKGVSYSFKMLSFCYQHAMFILEDIDPVIYASSIAYSFAAISVDTFHVFCVGGTMHILSDEVRKDISLMNAYYQKHGITVGNVHPRLHPYLDGGSQLKRIFTSGHRITNFYNESFETYLGYGLAETFSVPTHFCLDRSYASTPVGKPYGGYLVVVCDPEGNELPDGEQGEVRILGDLAQGYFKNPELTAETFEKLSDGTVMLHTHDIGYKDENGDLVLVNRNDMLVKINGMSVNPAEIDYAMSGIPGIRESAAKGFTDANGNSYICDFYASDDDTLTPDVLKEQLGRSLMPYMIPAVFVKMDRLPQTISSKVDYAALKAPKRGNAKYEAPETDTEKRICAAFETVLGMTGVGRLDDFFELGGDSLSLIDLLAKLNDSRLSLGDIAEQKTPKNLAALLERLPFEPEESSPLLSEYVLTPYQSHYRSACTKAEGITMGNSPFAFRLNKVQYSADQVRDALHEVIKAHPAFRTVLTGKEDGSVVQSFHTLGIPLPEIRTCSDAEVNERLSECIKPLPLFSDSLYRSVIFETETSLYLFLDIHHIITDYMSQQVILKDLFARLKGEDHCPDHYPQYLARINAKANAGTISSMKEALLHAFHGYTKHPAFDGSQFFYHTEMIRYDVTLKPDELRSDFQGNAPGIQAALIACALFAMHKDTGDEKVLSGWLYNGRDSGDKLNMMGLMITSLLSSVDFSTVHSAEELLGLVRIGIRKSLPTAEYSPGSLIGGPFEEDLLTVNYTLFKSGESLPEAEHISLINQNSANTCIFYLILNDFGNRLGELLFKYNDTVYSKDHIKRFIRLFFEAVAYTSKGEPWLLPLESH